MPDKNSVLVYAVDELASAVARLLLLSGHAVAIRTAEPHTVLRRKMAFADAWHDGATMLEGAEARLARQDADLLTGLRSGMYIPVLAAPLVEAVERWPWDIIVDARRLAPGTQARPRADADLTIVLGPGAAAGRDCDLVIELGGPDPGAILRTGFAAGGHRPLDHLEYAAIAPRSGSFRACRAIGEAVSAGEMIAIVDTLPVAAPVAGRLRGLMRSPAVVRAGEAVGEITTGRTAQVHGIHPADQAIARAVEFAIERERHDLPAGLLFGG